MSLTDAPSEIPFSNSSDDSSDFFSTLSISGTGISLFSHIPILTFTLGTQSAPVSAEPPRHAHADPIPRPLSVSDLKPQPTPFAAPPTFAAPFPKPTTTPFPTPSHTPAPTPVPVTHTPVAVGHSPVPFPGNFAAPFNPVQGLTFMFDFC